MSIHAGWLRILLEMRKKYGFAGNAIIWGVQDVHMNYAEAADVMRERGFEYIDIPISERNYMLSKNQQQWTSDPQRFMATKDLFRMLGFSSAVTLDAFPHDNPDILCDLNEPLPDGYKQKFDVLIDIGVIEHTSNGFQALENAGNLLKVGGHFVSFTPLFSPIQAAMFHPNPPFYYDILSANGFGNFTSYIHWMPDWDQHSDIRSIWLSYQYDDQVALFREHYLTDFFVVTQKLHHVQKFRTVLQNYYVKWHNEAGVPKPGNLPLPDLSHFSPEPARPSNPGAAINPERSLAVCLYQSVVPQSVRALLYVIRDRARQVFSGPSARSSSERGFAPKAAPEQPQIGRIELSPGIWVPYASSSTVPKPEHGLQSIPERMFVGNPPREQLYL